MAQHFTIFNLDGEIKSFLGNFGESYTETLDVLISSIASREQVLNPDATVGTWTNCRILCLGNFSTTFPKGVLKKEEISFLTRKGIGSFDIYDLCDKSFDELPEDTQSTLRHDIPLALVNLSKKEYVTIASVHDLRERLLQQRADPPSIASILLNRICWSQDPSLDTPYNGFLHRSGKSNLLSRGCWAGDRFAFWDMGDVRMHDLQDVSEEACLEVTALWATEYQCNAPPNIWSLSLRTEMLTWKHKGLWTDIPDDMTRKRLSEEKLFFNGLLKAVPSCRFPSKKLVKKVVFPISRVPAEIMSYIFRIALSLPLLRQASAPVVCPVVACSHVCRSWRAMAMADPFLWRTLNSLHHPKLTATFLARSQTKSKKIPLFIILQMDTSKYLSHNSNTTNDTNPNHRLNRFLSLATPHSAQWARLVCEGPASNVVNFLCGDLDYSSLVFLQIQCRNLEHTHLTYILPKAKHLEELRLHDSGHHWASSANERQPSLKNLRSKSLRSLVLTDVAPLFARCIRARAGFPNLCNLTLSGDYRQMFLPPKNATTLPAHIASRSKIKTVRDYLGTLPKIQTLTFYHGDCVGEILCELANSHLTGCTCEYRDPMAHKTILCPQLHTLEMSHIHPEVLADFVRTREKLGVPLRQLSVGGVFYGVQVREYFTEHFSPAIPLDLDISHVTFDEHIIV